MILGARIRYLHTLERLWYHTVTIVGIIVMFFLSVILRAHGII